MTAPWRVSTSSRGDGLNRRPACRPGEVQRRLGLIQIDEEHLASADLERPILVVKIRELGRSPLVVDGYARPVTLH